MNDLEQFISIYFNQDWNLDFKSPKDVVNHFVTVEPPEFVLGALKQLKELVASGKSEKELEGYVQNNLMCNYYPPGDNSSYTDWLKSVVIQMDEAIIRKSPK